MTHYLLSIYKYFKYLMNQDFNLKQTNVKLIWPKYHVLYIMLMFINN